MGGGRDEAKGGGLEGAMRSFLQEYRGGAGLIFLFDCDGTLAPLVERPELARLPPLTRAVLSELASKPRTVIGILSARDLEDLTRLVALPRALYAGTSGLELDLRGERIVHPDAASFAERLWELAAPLEEILREYPGAWLERKKYAFTVHYRAAAEADRSELRARALEALAPAGGEIRALDAPLAIEVTPATPWTKGSAVRKLFEASPEAVRRLLYAGDEANDEDAFRAAADLGGISIGIGERAPGNASYRLPDPRALVDLLLEFLEALEPGISGRLRG